MKKLFQGSGLFVISFLLFGALAWATPAGAGDRPAAPGLSFLFDKEAFSIVGSPAEPAVSGKISKLSLKLYGGYSYIGAADVNDGSNGYFEALETYAAEGGTMTGGFKPLHGGYDFGADLVYQITPNIGVGLGAGYMRNSKSSLGTLTDGLDELQATADSAVTAIPLRLGVFFTFPVSARLDLTADAGGTYYAGLKLDATQRFSANTTNFIESSVASLTAGSANLGFHGSLGVEYKFTPMFGFFVEAAGRYAKLKNFEKAEEILNSSFSGSETVEGGLYIVTYSYGSFVYSMFTVSETTPVDGPDATYRVPKFDLSGFSLQAGIRIHF
ncbi:MAG TPA: outer membrane beta-barrel protein [Acidobacteriota bacterium]|nr:outer membrane beta-barrel protein [Acidobacteriota bacterium]